jgi:hypothetical protein
MSGRARGPPKLAELFGSRPEGHDNTKIHQLSGDNYPTMTIEEIGSLPINGIAYDCVLFLHPVLI